MIDSGLTTTRAWLARILGCFMIAYGLLLLLTAPEEHRAVLIFAGLLVFAGLLIVLFTITRVKGYKRRRSIEATFRVFDRYEADGWSARGEIITERESLNHIRSAFSSFRVLLLKH